MPIGAFVTAHHESIRGVEARVAACVTQTQMEGERADAERRLATAAAALTDSCASRKALAAAQAAQEAAAAQLVALQGVVSTKVDRADLLRLQVCPPPLSPAPSSAPPCSTAPPLPVQAVAAELEAFADFKAGATARLADLGAELAASRAAHDMSVSSLSQLSGLLQARRAGVGSFRMLSWHSQRLPLCTPGRRESRGGQGGRNCSRCPARRGLPP